MSSFNRTFDGQWIQAPSGAIIQNPFYSGRQQQSQIVSQEQYDDTRQEQNVADAAEQPLMLDRRPFPAPEGYEWVEVPGGLVCARVGAKLFSDSLGLHKGKSNG